MGCAPSTPAATGATNGATNLNQAIPDQFETFGACALRFYYGRDGMACN